MRVRASLIGALYHPPRPQYSTDSLLDYVESCVAELTHDHPTSTVVLAGDFNQLPHSAVVAVGYIKDSFITYTLFVIKVSNSYNGFNGLESSNYCVSTTSVFRCLISLEYAIRQRIFIPIIGLCQRSVTV